MSAVEGKRILLLYARFFEYDLIVKNKLAEKGAYVDLFDARAKLSTAEKALLKKTELFYKRKQLRFHGNICKQTRGKDYDYIFTNEKLEAAVLEKYRQTFPNAKLILYLDDSVKNLRHVDRTFPFYDRVLTFDRSDSVKYGISFRPLFFNDFVRGEQTNDDVCDNDICFIGTAHSDRLKVINKLVKRHDDKKFLLHLFLQSKALYFYYRIVSKEYRKYPFSFFKYNKIGMSEVSRLMQKSKIILDIQHPNQTGLTMRTIESVGMGKKIVTTNADIRFYDFYNENNVFVLDRNEPVIDDFFFERSPVKLDAKVYEKYSLDSWIESVFGGEER